MPKLGVTMTEGTVEKWLVEEGKRVEKGMPLVEIMSDKAIIEIEALVSGTLVQIINLEGDTIPVGEVIALIEESREV